MSDITKCVPCKPILTNADRAVKLLRMAADIIEERSKQYNGNSDMFEWIGREVAMDPTRVIEVLIGVKEARLHAAPDHLDSLVDMVGYRAIHAVYKYGAGCEL